MSRPASQTGGDTFDLTEIDQGLLTVLGDATGHGIAPALSVTQMHAMLRMAFRLGADLETAFMQVNNQLAATLADDRFITAFIGLLDTAAHRMRFHSGGQAPILHFQAATGTCARHDPTSFPLAAMPLSALRPAVNMDLLPGDILVLLSDGFYEYENPAGEQFGEQRVEAILRSGHGKPMARAVGNPFRRRAGVRAGRAAGGRHDRGAGEARRCRGDVADVSPQLRFAAGDLRVHPRSSVVDMASILACCRRSISWWKNCSRTWSSTAPTAPPRSRIDMAAVPGGVEMALTDYDVEQFDVTRAPDADIDLPIEQRKPGGLGLHLIRRMVDSMKYEYSQERREGRTTFRKTLAGPARSGET